MNPTFAAAIAAALSLGGGLARADATATTELTGLRVQLFNLDPSRSDAPAVTFRTNAGSMARTDAASPATDTTSEDSRSGGSAFAPVSASSALGTLARSSASIAGNAWAGSEDVATFAFAAGNASQSEASAYLGDGDIFTPFTLSADTLMVLSVFADLSATAGTGAADFAISSVQLEFLGALGDNSQNSAANAIAVASGSVSTNDSVREELTVSFVNANHFAIDGTFFGGTDATADSAATPVPEPAGGALVFGALALFGLWHRARRHCVAQARQHVPM